MPTGIDRSEMIRLVEQQDAQIVDVLPEQEYIESHIPGAASIPFKELTAESASVLSKNRPVVVYCHDAL